MIKVDLLVTHNQYGSTHWFALGLKKALEKLGATVRLFAMDDSNMRESLNTLCLDPADLSCSFSYIGFKSEFSEDLFLGDYTQKPHLTYWIDGPIFSLPLFRSPYNYVSVVDALDFQGLKSIGGSRLLFLPHSVDVEEPYQKEDKKYDLVMIGSYLDFEERKRKWATCYSKKYQELLELSSHLVLNEPSYSISLAIHSALEQLQFERLEVPFEEIYFEIEYYCKGKDRFDLISSLKEFKIDVFGSSDSSNSWKKVLCGMKNVTVHAPTSYRESLDLLRQGKIVLNSSPQFRHGSHERVLNGLLKGACVITNENSYLQENITGGLLYYLPNTLEKLPLQIEDLLKDEDKREAYALLGREDVLKKYTWDNRAHEILAHFMHEN